MRVQPIQTSSILDGCFRSNELRFLYPLDKTIKEKIETIAKEIYGAAGVAYDELAEKKIQLYTNQGYSHLPICMAKTQLSLSHDPNLKGAPTGRLLKLGINECRSRLNLKDFFVTT